MKIITWNCNMAYRNKAQFILAFQPDIVVVQECENPERLKFPADLPEPTDIIWHGENPHKGVGVFAYNGYKLKIHKSHNPEFKTIIPIKVTGGNNDFMLFAVWANNPRDKKFQYVGQIWKAVHHYEKLLKHNLSIWAGDFNSNSIWDKPKREGNHTTLVKFLAERDIHSAYHNFYGQQHGSEAHPTYFLYRHEDKPYHMDYCFSSKHFLDRLVHVEVGAYADWRAYSDHKPIIVNFR